MVKKRTKKATINEPRRCSSTDTKQKVFKYATIKYNYANEMTKTFVSFKFKASHLILKMEEAMGIK